MNSADVIKFVAGFAVIASAIVILALYENAKAVPFDLSDLGNALIFIVTAGTIAFAFLATPKKS